MNNFDKALMACFNSEYEKLESLPLSDNDFTEEFEMKMQKLIKLQKSPFFKLATVNLKRVASFAIVSAVAAATTFTVAAAATGNFDEMIAEPVSQGVAAVVDKTETISQKVINTLKGFTIFSEERKEISVVEPEIEGEEPTVTEEIITDEIVVDAVDPENAPQTLEAIYAPTAIPEGYNLIEDTLDGEENVWSVCEPENGFCFAHYDNEENGDLLYFAQYTKACYQDVDSFGECDISAYTDSEGREFLVANWDTSYKAVLYDNGEYILHCNSGALTVDEIINIIVTAKAE